MQMFFLIDFALPMAKPTVRPQTSLAKTQNRNKVELILTVLIKILKTVKIQSFEFWS